MNFTAIKPNPAVDTSKINTFRVENFPKSDQVPWLDKPDWRAQVEALLGRREITAADAELCTHWAEHGYIVVPNMFPPEMLDSAWRKYDELIAGKALVPAEDYGASDENPLPGRVLNPHFHVSEFDQILRDEAATRLVSLLLGVKSLPFQTISGHKGTQQKAHSDSIHMTTYPQGYLVANWIAFEDIAPDSGPLEYYPGSHRLPYAYSRDCGIGLEEGRHGYDAYHAKYETYVQRQIVEHKLKPAYFYAKKGDVLFWHANLLHGGSRIANVMKSRRALVCHYFAEGCVCYHDYTGTPSHLTQLQASKQAMLTKAQFDSAAYLLLNPDVAAAGIDPYRHYEQFGHREGRRTGSRDKPLLSLRDFNRQRYLELNPDVAAAGVDAYQHYLEHGYTEGRRTH